MCATTSSGTTSLTKPPVGILYSGKPRNVTVTRLAYTSSGSTFSDVPTNAANWKKLTVTRLLARLMALTYLEFAAIIVAVYMQAI